jgi:hypothetical protein
MQSSNVSHNMEPLVADILDKYMQVSILKNGKEILVSSEKRAMEEVHNLLDKVHRLQVTNYELSFFMLSSVSYAVERNIFFCCKL